MTYYVMVFNSASDSFDCYTSVSTLKEANRIADRLMDAGYYVEIDKE